MVRPAGYAPNHCNTEPYAFMAILELDRRDPLRSVGSVWVVCHGLFTYMVWNQQRPGYSKCSRNTVISIAILKMETIFKSFVQAFDILRYACLGGNI